MLHSKYLLFVGCIGSVTHSDIIFFAFSIVNETTNENGSPEVGDTSEESILYAKEVTSCLGILMYLR